MKLHLLLPLLFLLVLPDAVSAAGRQLLIGTAERNGIYYPVGGAICRFVNQHRGEHGLSCKVQLTEGSFDNLQSLHRGRLDLAVVQSDRLAQAYLGQGDFAQEGPNEALRSLFSLYVEPFTIIARQGSSIHGFRDLKGRHIDIGTPGSGTHSIFRMLKEQLGWRDRHFASIDESSTQIQLEHFCAGEVDAILYVAGLPNRVVQQATRCGGRLVSLEPELIDAFIAGNPYYAPIVIPPHMYAGNPSATNTFGTLATVVTTAALSEQEVYRVLQSLFTDFDSFKSLHPAFAALRPEEMIDLGLTAPLHPGALRYYRDAGWLKEADSKAR